MPYHEMDLIWYGIENKIQAEQVAEVLGKTADEIIHIYNNLKRKRKTTEYLRMSPIIY